MGYGVSGWLLNLLNAVFAMCVVGEKDGVLLDVY